MELPGHFPGWGHGIVAEHFPGILDHFLGKATGPAGEDVFQKSTHSHQFCFVTNVY